MKRWLSLCSLTALVAAGDLYFIFWLLYLDGNYWWKAPTLIVSCVMLSFSIALSYAAFDQAMK